MRRLLAISIALLLSAPAGALAAHHIVAPGDPGSAQYQEDIPTAAGSRPVTSLQSGSTPTIVLPPGAVRKLEHRGAAGHTTIALAQQAAPAQGAPRLGSHPISYHVAPTLSVLASSLTGSAGGGLGIWLPIVLLVTLGAVIAAAVVRRRR